MSFVIVLDFVHDAINSALDKALADIPEAEASRRHLYEQLLDYYNEHGELPEFGIVKNEPRKD
jgi:hypothetical protein